MRRLALLIVLSCAPDLGIGDQLCEPDAGGCPSGLQCFPVTEVRASTGACLASTGATVCRPPCSTCPPVNPCGCQCPP